MTLLRSLLIATALAMPAAATAAPIAVYSANGAGQFDGQFADFFDDGADDLDISVSFETVGDTVTGSLLVSDFGGTLLESGSILDLILDDRPGTDRLTVLFGTLGGSAASRFGRLATAVFDFSLEDEDDGRFDPVRVSLFAEEPAPIPLPASVGLLVLGIGALAGLRRRRG